MVYLLLLSTLVLVPEFRLASFLSLPLHEATLAGVGSGERWLVVLPSTRATVARSQANKDCVLYKKSGCHFLNPSCAKCCTSCRVFFVNVLKPNPSKFQYVLLRFGLYTPDEWIGTLTEEWQISQCVDPMSALEGLARLQPRCDFE